ncbi:GNAT family N-acyltransferase [Okeania sp.]|uniref:N-acyl amino acid synthase FeeM domain-containing protein n=1 Tax=Okeania sp. TaxID=3100323 RepID=UPI002B4B3C9F|nr:GNAT family N-acyltransferase [Okeania sp.]MEB3341536.1 GNAT family N-acyltransferase [Okeania sp.]
MSISIQQVSTSEQLNLCHQMQIAIFHHELNLFGMQIPDDYDRSSLYMQIVDSQVVVGTYRIVPNTSLGLPIQETGFNLEQFEKNKICEMSRLVLLKEKRGKIPFSQVFSSARNAAKEHYNASTLVVAILPQNVSLFKRYGFSQVGEPLHDPTVKSTDKNESVIIPMQTYI